jgi:hypothetical protein
MVSICLPRNELEEGFLQTGLEENFVLHKEGKWVLISLFFIFKNN